MKQGTGDGARSAPFKTGARSAGRVARPKLTSVECLPVAVFSLLLHIFLILKEIGILIKIVLGNFFKLPFMLEAIISTNVLVVIVVCTLYRMHKCIPYNVLYF